MWSLPTLLPLTLHANGFATNVKLWLGLRRRPVSFDSSSLLLSIFSHRNSFNGRLKPANPTQTMPRFIEQELPASTGLFRTHMDYGNRPGSNGAALMDDSTRLANWRPLGFVNWLPATSCPEQRFMRQWNDYDTMPERLDSRTLDFSTTFFK